MRAQNLVGYKAYPDDIVEKFVEKAADAGIDIFLIFDALQDLRNCESAFQAVKKAGKKIEGSVQYNVSPFHTTEVFVSNALEQEKMGASLMHVEDMAGLMTPQAAYELVSALKKALKIPVHLHCHCTGGMAEMAYWEAIRAGVDGLDVCVSSMSMGPAHPPIESFVAALQGTSRDPKIDVGQFKSINDDFLKLRQKYAAFENADHMNLLSGIILTDLLSQFSDSLIHLFLRDQNSDCLCHSFSPPLSLFPESSLSLFRSDNKRSSAYPGST